jgi:hypothetical protein
MEPKPGWVRKSKNGTTVIFVHGILSSTKGAWLSKNGVFWPKMLSEEQSIDDVGIYLFGYRADAFSGTYSLDDVVDAMREYFRLDGLWSEKQLIFVCHSMGGIVARRFLITQQLQLIRSHTKTGLFLIASPSLGATYANFVNAIAPIYNLQLDLLRFSQDNAWLNALDRDLINLKEGEAIEIFGKELVEDKFLVKRLLGFSQIVPPWAGAKYFGEPLRIAYSDHLTIAKPESSTALQHRILVEFIRLAIGKSVAKQSDLQMMAEAGSPKGADTALQPSSPTRNPILIDWSFPDGLVKPRVAISARTGVIAGLALVAVVLAIWGGAKMRVQREQRRVESRLTDLMKQSYASVMQSYASEIQRFNGGAQARIKPCPSMVGWPAVERPLDPKTKQGMEFFVAPIFWAAEQMMLGRVAQCYEIAGETPALIVDGNNANYRIIATVRIYFNKIPKGVDRSESALWISSDNAATFSPDSSSIVVVQYKTARSTYFGSTVSVFSHAWGSPPLNVHDVYECRIPGNLNCKEGPDDDSPVQALVVKPDDVDTENARQTEAAVESLVRSAIEQNRE